MSVRVDYDAAITEWATEFAHNTLNWQAIRDLNRMINWELWHGPLPSDYWTVAEPSDTPWPGDWETAAQQLIALMEPLPDEVWVDDEGVVYADDPHDDDHNWQATCSHCGDYVHMLDDGVWVDNTDGDACTALDNENGPHDNDGDSFWCGPDAYSKYNVRKAILHDEVFKHVF